MSIGPYKILALIGAGGMGEVYRGRDTRLDRDVAVKVLSRAFAGDPDRMKRFEREAKSLATLSHAHIAQVHGLEESGQVRALIMEFVEGEDLSQRIARGAIPVDEAIAIARQIADALEAAHDRGIVHRDLKPANIKLAPDGTVKVLDFGLAKAFVPEGGEASTEAMNSPTITNPGTTRTGMVLGTAAYMSPEQARGRSVDKRADIWAFGAVLYEMLTGRRAFGGETVADMFAALMTKTVDVNELPPDTPRAVKQLIARCLTRDPRTRLRDIGEARITLDTPAAEAAAPLQPSVPASRIRLWLQGGIVGAAIVAAIAVVALPQALRTPGGVTHLSITLPAHAPLMSMSYGSLAITRDGTRIAYLAETGASTRILLRDLSSQEFLEIPGTEGALSIFFSPDGSWLGFGQSSRLRKVAIGGGSPLSIEEGSLAPFGAEWNADDSIVFSRFFSSGLFSVPAAGGEAKPLLLPERSKQELAFTWPQVLPGNAGILFTRGLNSITTFDDAQVVIEVPGQPGSRQTLAGGAAGRFLPSGHLVFGHAGRMLAAPFSVSERRLTGAPVPVVDGVLMDPTTGMLGAAVSDTGTLVYAQSPILNLGPDRFVSVDRRGNVQTLSAEIRFSLNEMSLSPDGERLAVRVAKANDDIHVYDIAGGVFSRFTTEGGDQQGPVWTPDGRRLIYSSNQAGPNKIYWRPIDGSSDPEPLVEQGDDLRPMAVSPDGKLLVFTQQSPDTGLDIMMASLSGDRTPRPLLKTPFRERFGAVSPDGRWLAYESDESGRAEVHVMRFPDGHNRAQVSIDGGSEPLWSRDGRELYFTHQNTVMIVSIDGGRARGAARRLSDYRLAGVALTPGRRYAVRSDGSVLAVTKDNREPIREIRIILNWFEDLKARVPIQGR